MTAPAYSGILPANIIIQHQVWTDGGTTDNHNNEVEVYGPPIARRVIAVYPLHRLPHHDVADSEFVARTMIDFIMDVPDASIYSKNDRVIFEGKNFRVEGFPFNWGNHNPFGFDTSFFGGSVHIERVT
jgi:hypothetical protein